MLKTVLKSAVCLGFLMSVNVAKAELNVDSADGDLGGLAASPWQNTTSATITNTSADASGTTGTTTSGYVADTIAGPKSDATLVGNSVPLPTFVGENTTWTKAMGQKAIAPEVNIANMLIMTDHLRKLGYKIPPEFDEFIRNSPENLRAKIMGALNDIRNSEGKDGQIVESTFNKFLTLVEKQTGFDLTNIFDVTFGLLEKGPR